MKRVVKLVLLWVVCVIATAGVAAPNIVRAMPATPQAPTDTIAVQLVTVPVVVGATFSLDGIQQITGADGIANFSVPPDATGITPGRFALVTNGSHGPGTNAEFLKIRAGKSSGPPVFYALYLISNDVSFQFHNTVGDDVPSEQIASMTIKSSIGEDVTVAGANLNKPVHLTSQRVVFFSGVPVVKDIYYSVQEVMISGTNTVNRSQQKFFPSQITSYQVATQFFRLTIHTSDSLFGFSTGSAVLVRTPDKQELSYPIHDGQAILPALPRGDYEMRIQGLGLKTWRPISASRDQTVDLELLSYLDGAFVMAVLLLIAGIGIVLGRRRLRKRRFGGDRQGPSADPGTTQQNEPILTGSVRGGTAMGRTTE